MSNKQLKIIIIAMMYASGLDPVLGDDYYQEADASAIGRFLEGVCSYFELDRNHFSLHFKENQMCSG